MIILGVVVFYALNIQKEPRKTSIAFLGSWYLYNIITESKYVF